MTEREKRAAERAAFLEEQKALAEKTTLGRTHSLVVDHDNRSSEFVDDAPAHAEDITEILYGKKAWRDRWRTGNISVEDIVKRIHTSQEGHSKNLRQKAAYKAATEKLGGDINPFITRILEEAGALQGSAMGDGAMRGPYSPELLDAYWDNYDESKQLPEHQNIGSTEWLEYIASDAFILPNEWKKYAEDKRSGKDPRMPIKDVDLQKREYEYYKLMDMGRPYKNFKDFQKSEYPESYKKSSDANKKRNKYKKTVGDSTSTHMTSNQTYKEGQ